MFLHCQVWTRRQKLDSRSGGTLPLTEGPSCQLLTPRSRRIHFYLKNRKSTSETGATVRVHVCVCAFALFSSSLNSQPPNLSLQGQLSHRLAEPDSHSATPTPPSSSHLAHISISLRTSECNLLSLYLTLGHPSITETVGKTIDTVCAHTPLSCCTITAPFWHLYGSRKRAQMQDDNSMIFFSPMK